VLAKKLHHVRKIQDRSADSVELVNHDSRNKPVVYIAHKLPKLGTVDIFAAVTLIAIFPEFGAFQFVFAEIDLAFDGNAVGLVDRLPRVNCVNSRVIGSFFHHPLCLLSLPLVAPGCKINILT
jgi:hypothetical protein